MRALPLLALVYVLCLCASAKVSDGATAEVLLMNSLLQMQAREESESDELVVVSTGDWVASVAAIVGAYHCETGNSSVIAEYASLAAECPDLAFNFTGSDSRYEASFAIQTLVEAPDTDFVVGATRSATTIPLALVSGALNVAQTSFFSTSQELSDRASFRRFTRTIPSDADTAMALCSLLSLYGLSHVGMLAVDDEYGGAYRDALVASCAKHEIAVLAEMYRDGPEEQFQASLVHAMDELVAARVNVVVVVAFATGVGQLLRYALANGLVREGRLFVFSDAVSGGGLQGLVADDPALAAALRGQQLIFANAGRADNPVFQRFADVWESAAHDPALMAYVRARLPGGDRFVLARALQVPAQEAQEAQGDGNSNGEGEDLFMGLSAENAAFTGLSVEEVFASSRAELAAVAPYAYDAVFAACRAMCRASSLDGEDVYVAELDESFGFQGASGRVVFDAATGSRAGATANYELFSVSARAGAANSTPAGSVRDSEAVGALAGEREVDVVSTLIARWTGTSWEEAPGGLLFPPGDTSVVPRTTDAVPEERNEVSAGARAFAYVAMAATELFCFAMLVFTFVHRNHPVILCSQRTLLATCLLGVVVSTAAVFPLSVDDGPGAGAFAGSRFLSVSCNLWWALWTVGATLAYGALIAKLYRVRKIFHSKLKRLRVSNWVMYRYIFGFLAVAALLLGLWFALAPLEWEREVLLRDETFGTPLESLGRCNSATHVSAAPFQGLVVLYNLALLAIATGMAFKVRHVQAGFQESTYLFTAVACMLQIYLLGAPIVLAIDETETSGLLIVRAGIICINNLVLVALLMVPKIVAMYHKPAEAGTDTQRTHLHTRANKTQGAADAPHIGGPGPADRAGPADREKLLRRSATTPLPAAVVLT